MPFLPFSIGEIQNPDFVLITPEAYVDHPSFGHAIVSRIIEDGGFSIAILSQPSTDADFMRFGKPKIAFLISGGVVDSMVNNYTASKKRRSTDVYSEGGAAGKRPDRAVTVYTKRVKKFFPDIPVIIGGMEASLRRMAHYDYWSDSVFPTILADSGADLLMYGMGERAWWDIMDLLKRGAQISKIRDVRGTAYLSSYEDLSDNLKEMFACGKVAFCPTFDEVKSDKKAFAKAFKIQSANSDFITGKHVVQKHGVLYAVVNPPARPLTTEEMDKVYSLPYMRLPHSSYLKKIPAIEEVRFSITSHRGCFGGCSYCALSFHQGKVISKRSKESILSEAENFVSEPDFKGYIHDVGGPTANFRNVSCEKQKTCGICKNKQCIGHEKCENLTVDHTEYLDILRTLREINGVKKVFIRSGIRFDYIMYDKKSDFFKELVEFHVSGQLKVAPEHNAPHVLKLMNKPPFEIYEQFAKKFKEITMSIKKEQYLVPYLISSHPACTEKDAVNLAQYLLKTGHTPEQVQDFYPTPATKSTCIFYTGIDPDTGETVYVPKTEEEKRVQRALLQSKRDKNKEIAGNAFKKYNVNKNKK